MSVRSIEGLQCYLRRLCDEAVPPPDTVLVHRFVAAEDREALALLIDGAGGQWDPEVVELFVGEMPAIHRLGAA